jgi:hypothetical protein
VVQIFNNNKTEIMKKLFLVAGALMVTSTLTFAHNKNGLIEARKGNLEENDYRKEIIIEQRIGNPSEVSGITKSQFTNDFPDATNVHFESTRDFDKISFMQGAKEITAYYDYQSQLLGTTEKKAFTDLPSNAQNEILEKYSGYAIADVVEFNDNQSNNSEMVLYGNSYDDGDNYFVELKANSKAILVKVDLAGGVQFATTLR